MNSALKRILVAEDEPEAGALLTRILTKYEYAVHLVGDGDEALKILSEPDAPALALLDWMMPGIDGPEVCRRVRGVQNRVYTYLILLTARQDKEEITAGLEAGADDYIVKPFDADELRARLKVGQRVAALERQLMARVTELETALTDVRELKQLLPICMYCKDIREGEDYWRQIDEYIHRETGADFSHGICPDCLARLLNDPEIRMALRPGG